jgi:hypothetical protein
MMEQILLLLNKFYQDDRNFLIKHQEHVDRINKHLYQNVTKILQHEKRIR